MVATAGGDFNGVLETSGGSVEGGDGLFNRGKASRVQQGSERGTGSGNFNVGKDAKVASRENTVSSGYFGSDALFKNEERFGESNLIVKRGENNSWESTGVGGEFSRNFWVSRSNFNNGIFTAGIEGVSGACELFAKRQEINFPNVQREKIKDIVEFRSVESIQKDTELATHAILDFETKTHFETGSELYQKLFDVQKREIKISEAVRDSGVELIKDLSREEIDNVFETLLKVGTIKSESSQWFLNLSINEKKRILALVIKESDLDEVALLELKRFKLSSKDPFLNLGKIVSEDALKKAQDFLRNYEKFCKESLAINTTNYLSYDNTGQLVATAGGDFNGVLEAQGGSVEGGDGFNYRRGNDRFQEGGGATTIKGTSRVFQEGEASGRVYSKFGGDSRSDSLFIPEEGDRVLYATSGGDSRRASKTEGSQIQSRSGISSSYFALSNKAGETGFYKAGSTILVTGLDIKVPKSFCEQFEGTVKKVENTGSENINIINLSQDTRDALDEIVGLSTVKNIQKNTELATHAILDFETKTHFEAGSELYQKLFAAKNLEKGLTGILGNSRTEVVGLLKSATNQEVLSMIQTLGKTGNISASALSELATMTASQKRQTLKMLAWSDQLHSVDKTMIQGLRVAASSETAFDDLITGSTLSKTEYWDNIYDWHKALSRDIRLDRYEVIGRMTEGFISVKKDSQRYGTVYKKVLEENGSQFVNLAAGKRQEYGRNGDLGKFSSHDVMSSNPTTALHTSADEFSAAFTEVKVKYLARATGEVENIFLERKLNYTQAFETYNQTEDTLFSKSIERMVSGIDDAKNIQKIEGLEAALTQGRKEFMYGRGAAKNFGGSHFYFTQEQVSSTNRVIGEARNKLVQLVPLSDKNVVVTMKNGIQHKMTSDLMVVFEQTGNTFNQIDHIIFQEFSLSKEALEEGKQMMKYSDGVSANNKFIRSMSLDKSGMQPSNSGFKDINTPLLNWYNQQRKPQVLEVRFLEDVYEVSNKECITL